MRFSFTTTANADGIIKASAPHQIQMRCVALAGKRVTVTIETAKKKRSLEQNAYYFGCVVPIMQATFNQLGNDFSREQTHDILRAKFLTVDIVNVDEVIAQRIKSTTELTTTQFAEYILQIQQWAASTFYVHVPDPNEQTEIQL